MAPWWPPNTLLFHQTMYQDFSRSLYIEAHFKMEVKSNVSLSYAAHRREGAQQVNGVLHIIGADNGHGRHALSLPFSLFLPLSIISTKCPYATTPMIEAVGSVRNGYLSHIKINSVELPFLLLFFLSLRLISSSGSATMLKIHIVDLRDLGFPLGFLSA